MRRSSKLRQQAFLVGAVIFAGAAVLGYLSRTTPKETSSSPVTKSAESTPVALLSTPQAVRPHIESPQDAENRWKKFQDRFGSQLSPTFTSDHRLVRVRAGEERTKRAENFTSGDKSSALARAQEILRDAGELVGLNSEYPVEPRAVRSDEISSQIEWVQTYHGVPIEPFGRITLQLDAEGGLNGLYSSYISDPVIANTASLSDESARAEAISHLHFTPDQPLGSAPAPRGELILFSQGPQDSSQPIELHYAYRYWISGHEVVVDASKGEILSDKDRRQN